MRDEHGGGSLDEQSVENTKSFCVPEATPELQFHIGLSGLDPHSNGKAKPIHGGPGFDVPQDSDQGKVADASLEFVLSTPDNTALTT